MLQYPPAKGNNGERNVLMSNYFLVKKSTHSHGYRDKKSHLLLGSMLLVLLAMSALAGCADHSAKNRELLAENYHSLSNDDLLLYYYKLEDQIDVVEHRSSKPSISLGFGIGSFGHSSAGSAGVGVTTGGNKQDVATNLRERRNEVKLELQHRGLKP
jgi:hypothetical protein